MDGRWVWCGVAPGWQWLQANLRAARQRHPLTLRQCPLAAAVQASAAAATRGAHTAAAAAAYMSLTAGGRFAADFAAALAAGGTSDALCAALKEAHVGGGGREMASAAHSDAACEAAFLNMLFWGIYQFAAHTHASVLARPCCWRRHRRWQRAAWRRLPRRRAACCARAAERAGRLRCTAVTCRARHPEMELAFAFACAWHDACVNREKQ